MKMPGVQETHFCFFDVPVSLRSDSAHFMEFFECMYRRFLISGLSPKALPLEINLASQISKAVPFPALFIAGQAQPLSEAMDWEGYVYDLILNAILSRVHSHLLIHAGVVAKKDRALILAGDSGHGKTTLALSQARRGHKFLSDELAPIRRGEHSVDPFPRSLRIRPGTLELAGYPPALPGLPVWFDKLLLDIEEIQPGSLGQTAEIGWIVILKNSLDLPVDDNKEPKERELGIFLDRLDDDLLDAAAQIGGVDQVWRSVELGYPVLRLRAASRMEVLKQVERLCQERQILVLDVSKRALIQPSFDQAARLEAIPKTQAVMELIRQFQPGHKSELLQAEYQGSPGRLFMELATCIEKAKCFRLTVGSLDQMVELLNRLE